MVACQATIPTSFSPTNRWVGFRTPSSSTSSSAWKSCSGIWGEGGRRAGRKEGGREGGQTGNGWESEEAAEGKREGGRKGGNEGGRE